MITPNTPSTALVIGGVGGIGESLALRLVAGGSRVVITSRASDRVNEAAARIGAIAHVTDVRDEATLASAIAIAAPDGKLAALAYCVGSIPLKPLARTTADDMMDAYRLNTIGAMLAVRHAAEALKAGGGSVVLFSSIAARQGFPNHTAIAAAKAGVEGLTVALAAELGPSVRVNAIAPSLTATPLAAALTSNARMAEGIAAMHPIPRLGSADEMAALAAFLLSADAGWITGQVIAADGGRSTVRTGKSG